MSSLKSHFSSTNLYDRPLQNYGLQNVTGSLTDDRGDVPKWMVGVLVLVTLVVVAIIILVIVLLLHRGERNSRHTRRTAAVMAVNPAFQMSCKSLENISPENMAVTSNSHAISSVPDIQALTAGSSNIATNYSVVKPNNTTKSTGEFTIRDEHIKGDTKTRIDDVVKENKIPILPPKMVRDTRDETSSHEKQGLKSMLKNQRRRRAIIEHDGNNHGNVGNYILTDGMSREMVAGMDLPLAEDCKNAIYTQASSSICGECVENEEALSPDHGSEIAKERAMKMPEAKYGMLKFRCAKKSHCNVAESDMPTEQGSYMFFGDTGNSMVDGKVDDLHNTEL